VAHYVHDSLGMETTFQHTLTLLSAYSFFVALVAPFLGGEIAILALAILSGQGTFPFLSVVAGSFLGMLALDMMWFLLFRFPIFGRMKDWSRGSETYRNAERRIEAIARGNDVLILLISKIMIGTRILVLAYIGMRNITLGRFVLYDSVATGAWAILLCAFGWASGRGYMTAMGGSASLSTQLLYLSLFVGVFSVGLFVLRRRILNI